MGFSRERLGVIDLVQSLGGIVGSSVERAPWGWGLLFGVVALTIWQWPTLQAQLIAAKEKLRSEKRLDNLSCDEKIKALDDRLTLAENAAHNFEMKLVGVLAAYRILDVELENANPTSPGLMAARKILRDTFAVSPSTPADMVQTILNAV